MELWRWLPHRDEAVHDRDPRGCLRYHSYVIELALRGYVHRLRPGSLFASVTAFDHPLTTLVQSQG